MARKRMIDPRIWDSQQVMQLSPEAFKTFIFLISQADDAGKMQVCWQMLASRIFPFGDINSDAIKALVVEMDGIGLVTLYVVDGKEFIKHPNWTRFQKIDRPSESSIPDPPPLVERSSKSRRTFDERSRKCRRNGIEEKGIEENRNSDSTNARREPAADAAIGDCPNDVVKPDPLYHSIEQAFLSKNDERFTNYGKEGKAIHGLIVKAKARAPGAEENLLKSMLAQFWKLRSTGDKFWQGQPFLPSALNASGIWDRVLEGMRNLEKMADPEAMAIALGDVF